MSHSTRIVVVGGGFGGLYAATYLSRSEAAQQGAQITLVDRKNYFTFTPLLAEVAAGTLGRQHVTYPYRVLGKRYGFDFVQDTACDVDVQAGVVRTQRTEIPYDFLILAMGAEPRFFGNERVQELSLPLTSVDDALAIRNRVIGALERAVVTSDDEARQRLLTFVVAGAGPAGVEVASEIHSLANVVLRPYYTEIPEMRVVLADGGDRILPGWDDELARVGLDRLRERGIDVRLRTRIADVSPGLVVTKDAEGQAELGADTLIWTAGMTPVSWASSLPIATERGAIKINSHLQVDGHENVFAVGDVTTLENGRAGRPYPRVAPIAISQGVRAAANIENLVLDRDLEPYQAHHAGKIVSLGSGVALVDVLGIRVTGVLAWWIYRGAYLLKLVGTKNKIRVLISLALNQLFEPDITTEASAPAT